MRLEIQKLYDDDIINEELVNDPNFQFHEWYLGMTY
jgi:hypothetical protein